MNHPYPIYCRSCRQEIDAGFEYCPHCGASQTRPQEPPRPHVPIPQSRPQARQRVPDSFARTDYRFVACPYCGKPVRRSNRGNPPKVTCPACDCTFLLDRRGGVPVVCPSCGSTSCSGGGFPFWALLFGAPGVMLSEMQPTRYVCLHCDCHFIGEPGADMVFGFFISH